MIIKLIIGLYGGSSIAASIVHGGKKSIKVSSAGLMLLGGILMVTSVFLESTLGLGLLIAGGLLVHISAIMNGKMMYGQINKKHHIIRLIVTIFLVAYRAIEIL